MSVLDKTAGNREERIMLAKVKKTGEIVDVYERYDELAMETVFEELAGSYSRDELDFSVDETKESESDLRISVEKLRDILEDVASSQFAPRILDDDTLEEIINRVKEKIQ